MGMPQDRIHTFKDSLEATKKLAGLLQQGDLILVKGSRGIKMESIIEQLKEEG